jgi:ATP-binding cassette subfamily F protein 3
MEKQLELKARLEALEKKLGEEATPEDLEEYSLLHEHFLEAEGYSAENDIRVVLQRMGFSPEEFSKSTDKLSGGEKTRLAIARLLLEEPDLLILDEPTNHLDLQATEWLEAWLRQYHGAVLLVSHDRAFLESTAERVLEMRDGSVKSYPGPFTKFLKLKEEEDARLAEVAKRQDQQIAKMDEFVRRFMNSQRTAQARGRLKLMNRMLETKVEAPKHDRGMAAGFGKVKRSGDIALQTKDLQVGFPSRRLFGELNWTVEFADRWGVIGENGAGKSTLIKTVLDLQKPLGGTYKLGTNVSVGYFSQDTQELDPEKSPLDFLVWDCDMLPADARNLLGRFLFSGDDVFRPIKTLSGGEKNKLSLARLTHENPNLLILDEPTNHLDIDSREALGNVLREYGGTLILISHDRYLLSQVTDHTLDVRKTGCIIYPGSYESYRARDAKVPLPEPAPSNDKGVPETQLSPRELSKEIGRMEKLIGQIEEDISRHEERIKQIEQDLSNLPADADVFAISQMHQATQEALEGAMSSWEESSLQLEELRSMQGQSTP